MLAPSRLLPATVSEHLTSIDRPSPRADPDTRIVGLELVTSAAPNWTICACADLLSPLQRETNIRASICNCFRPDMPLPLSTDRNRTRSSDGARIRALHPRQVGRAAKQAVQVQLPRRADRATADQEIATMHQLLRMPLAPVKLPDGGPPRRTSRSHDSALVNALAARRCTEHE